MRSAILRTLAGLLVGLVMSSCGGSKKGAPTATESAGQIIALDEGSGQLALEKRFADYRKDVVLDADGRVGKGSKRSSFENKQMTHIGGNLQNKEFAVNRYSKKNWNGTKNFDREKFTSTKNRWDGEEWFVRQQAKESGTAARSQGQAYAAGNYQANTAREQSSSRLDRPSDLRTEIRQRDTPKPLIMDKDDYAKMSLSDSKRLLGRE